MVDPSIRLHNLLRLNLSSYGL